jgi:hypothetical protein
MFAWLQNAIRNKALRVYRSDLDPFLAIISNMTEEELGEVLAQATRMRHAIETSPERFGFHAKASLLEPRGFLRANPRSDVRMGKIIRLASQGKQTLTVNSLLIWLHTLRAVAFPELQPSVRALWKELSRGFPCVPQGAQAVEIEPEWYEGYECFPEGYAPDNDD